MPEPFAPVVSRLFALDQPNIDTDQIIPARFLTTTTRQGLGSVVFYDWRYDENGGRREEAPLNRIAPDTHQILVAGANFGCGSSREHAPWALLDFGFRVVIAPSIADIFTANALKNGLLPISVGQAAHQALLAQAGGEACVDLAAQTVRAPDGAMISFAVEPFARACLLAGADELGWLLSQAEAISAFEATL